VRRAPGATPGARRSSSSSRRRSRSAGERSRGGEPSARRAEDREIEVDTSDVPVESYVCTKAAFTFPCRGATASHPGSSRWRPSDRRDKGATRHVPVEDHLRNGHPRPASLATEFIPLSASSRRSTSLLPRARSRTCPGRPCRPAGPAGPAGPLRDLPVRRGSALP
jgi:hypothetical protein